MGADSYLARFLLVGHRLLGVLLGLLHVVRWLLDVSFDPVHHLPLREAVTPVERLEGVARSGVSNTVPAGTRCPHSTPPQDQNSRPQACSKYSYCYSKVLFCQGIVDPYWQLIEVAAAAALERLDKTKHTRIFFFHLSFSPEPPPPWPGTGTCRAGPWCSSPASGSHRAEIQFHSAPALLPSHQSGSVDGNRVCVSHAASCNHVSEEN